jgi:hypothetical protein
MYVHVKCDQAVPLRFEDVIVYKLLVNKENSLGRTYLMLEKNKGKSAEGQGTTSF